MVSPRRGLILARLAHSRSTGDGIGPNGARTRGWNDGRPWWKRRRASGWFPRDCFQPKTPGRLSSLGLTRPASSLPDPVSLSRATHAPYPRPGGGCFCVGGATQPCVHGRSGCCGTGVARVGVSNLGQSPFERHTDVREDSVTYRSTLYLFPPALEASSRAVLAARECCTPFICLRMRSRGGTRWPPTRLAAKSPPRLPEIPAFIRVARTVKFLEDDGDGSFRVWLSY